MVAGHLNIHTVTARMLTDQYGAVSAFKRLGFEQQQILEKHVTDIDGNPADLLVMSADMSS